MLTLFLSTPNNTVKLFVRSEPYTNDTFSRLKVVIRPKLPVTYTPYVFHF